MFNKKFEIVELRVGAGVEIRHMLNDKRQKVNETIEWYKENFENCEMVSRNKMIVWA